MTPGDAARLAHRVVLPDGCPVRIAADLALDADAPPGQRNRETILTCEGRIETTMSVVAS